jgi:inosine/xanthosine triphosphate pyrophosphatase family protein
MALALSASDAEAVRRRMRERGGEDPAAAAESSRVDAFVAEGILEGRIARGKRGSEGFGYDPLFEIPSAGKTLAEMGNEAKNKMSHRYRALVEIRELLLRWGLALPRGE